MENYGWEVMDAGRAMIWAEDYGQLSHNGGRSQLGEDKGQGTDYWIDVAEGPWQEWFPGQGEDEGGLEWRERMESEDESVLQAVPWMGQKLNGDIGSREVFFLLLF